MTLDPRQSKLNSQAAAFVPASQQKAANLWGIWEMWVDFPSKVPSPTGSTGAASASSGKWGKTRETKASTTSPTSANPSMALFPMTPQYSNQQSWLDAVKSLGMFSTAEGFWGIHDNVVPPSGLPNGGNYYLFRHNIPPMWEHECNRRGGKWIMTFGNDQFNVADKAFMNLCIAAIGEQFPGPEEEICGVVGSKRKSGFKVSVWTRTAKDEKVQRAIGHFIKVVLGGAASGQGQLVYLEHTAILEAGGGTTRSPTSGMPPPSSSFAPPRSPSPTQQQQSAAGSSPGAVTSPAPTQPLDLSSPQPPASATKENVSSASKPSVCGPLYTF